jgi:hypothetical protein
MAVGYVQLALFRSCGNGKLPAELAGVGVVSQLSPPPLPELLEPPPLPELPLEPPLELPDPPLEPPLPLLLELLAPSLPLDDPPLLELEPEPPPVDGSPGLADAAQPVRPRNPMTMAGSEWNCVGTGPPKKKGSAGCDGWPLNSSRFSCRRSAQHPLHRGPNPDPTLAATSKNLAVQSRAGTNRLPGPEGMARTTARDRLIHWCCTAPALLSASWTPPPTTQLFPFSRAYGLRGCASFAFWPTGASLHASGP